MYSTVIARSSEGAPCRGRAVVAIMVENGTVGRAQVCWLTRVPSPADASRQLEPWSPSRPSTSSASHAMVRGIPALFSAGVRSTIEPYPSDKSENGHYAVTRRSNFAFPCSCVKVEIGVTHYSAILWIARPAAPSSGLQCTASCGMQPGDAILLLLVRVLRYVWTAQGRPIEWAQATQLRD